MEAVLDAAQNVAAAYRYDPFGKLLAQTGSLTQPYGFSTKRYNAPVGMVQYEFRNYFPELARWDRRDPLGEAGGMNLYAFVGNNPVNWVDPWGLLTQAQRQAMIANWTAAGAGIGSIIGFLGGGGGGMLTGPGAVAAVPAGAYAGAATGAGIGGIVGNALGSTLAAMMSHGSDNFEKMRQGNNKSKNKDFKDAFKRLQKDLGRKLGKAEQRKLHDYITKQGYEGFWDIYDAGMEIFGPCQ